MRDRSLDILKGWSILAIMLLHYEQGIFSGVVNAWIGSFMVSAFYLTAAWVLTLKPLPTAQEAAGRLWKSLGVPYVTFSILICGFTFLMCLLRQMEWQILARDIYKFLILRGIGTLWFLPALFFGELIFLIFVRQKLPVKMLMLAATMLYAALYWQWASAYRETGTLMKIIDAPLNELWRIGNAWTSIAVFYAFARTCRRETETLTNWELLLAAVISLGIYTILISSGLRGAWNLLVGWLGPIGLLFLAKATQNLPGIRLCEYFGRNSLIVMALHFSILQQICIIINHHRTGEPGLSGYPALVYFTVSLLLLPWLIGVCRKCPRLLHG